MLVSPLPLSLPLQGSPTRPMVPSASMVRLVAQGTVLLPHVLRVPLAQCHLLPRYFWWHHYSQGAPLCPHSSRAMALSPSVPGGAGAT